MKFVEGDKVIVDGQVGYVREVDNTNKREPLYLVVESLKKKFSVNYGWYLPREVEKAA